MKPLFWRDPLGKLVHSEAVGRFLEVGEPAADRVLARPLTAPPDRARLLPVPKRTG